jgi:hypothetical protein
MVWLVCVLCDERRVIVLVEVLVEAVAVIMDDMRHVILGDQAAGQRNVIGSMPVSPIFEG